MDLRDHQSIKMKSSRFRFLSKTVPHTRHTCTRVYIYIYSLVEEIRCEWKRGWRVRTRSADSILEESIGRSSTGNKDVCCCDIRACCNLVCNTLADVFLDRSSSRVDSVASVCTRVWRMLLNVERGGWKMITIRRSSISKETRSVPVTSWRNYSDIRYFSSSFAIKFNFDSRRLHAFISFVCWFGRKKIPIDD